MKLDLAIAYCQTRVGTVGDFDDFLQFAIDGRYKRLIYDFMIKWFHFEWTGECWMPCQHLPLWKMTADCQSYVACRKCEMILKPPEIEVVE